MSADAPINISNFRYFINMSSKVNPALHEHHQERIVACFAKLRETVMSRCKPGIDKETQWKCYVTMAVRRFNFYVNALRLKYPETIIFQPLRSYVYKYLPPVDILMVWFYFQEIRNAFHANFLVDDFISFTQFPIPFKEISHAIDKKSMFKVGLGTRNEVTKLVNGYMKNLSKDESFEYDSYRPFSPNIELPLFCIMCWKNLGNHPLTTVDSDGFVDDDFMMDPYLCDCIGAYKLTRRTIGSGILARDMKKSRFYPKIKHFDYYLGPDTNDKMTFKFSPPLTARDDMSKARVESNRGGRLALQDYTDINPISSTIPTEATIYIREDLVAFILSRGNFINKTFRFDWYHSQYEHQ